MEIPDHDRKRLVRRSSDLSVHCPECAKAATRPCAAARQLLNCRVPPPIPGKRLPVTCITGNATARHSMRRTHAETAFDRDACAQHIGLGEGQGPFPKSRK